MSEQDDDDEETPTAVIGTVRDLASWMPEGIARVLEHAFDYLDAPPLRVHQEDVPLPYAANLEKLALPQVDEIVDAVKGVCGR